MEYEFVYDTRAKTHTIEMIGEQVAMAKFLNQELHLVNRDNKPLFDLIDRLTETREGRLQFAEWFLEVEEDEVSVVNNALLQEQNAELPEDFQQADWELRCDCGKDDLVNLLSAWADFIENH